jgi:hypothetical protein
MHALLLLLNSVSFVAPPESTLALKGGNYLDVRAGVLRPNGAMLVRGGRIVELHSPESGWHAPEACLRDQARRDRPPAWCFPTALN